MKLIDLRLVFWMFSVFIFALMHGGGAMLYCDALR